MTGAELRELRMRLGLTQEALARRLHYHPNYMSRLERGEVGITPRLAHQLTQLQEEYTSKKEEHRPQKA